MTARAAEREFDGVLEIKVSNMAKTKMMEEQVSAPRMEGYGLHDTLYHVERLSWFEVIDQRKEEPSKWVLHDDQRRIYAFIVQEDSEQADRPCYRTYVVLPVYVGTFDAYPLLETFDEAIRYAEIALNRVFYPWEIVLPEVDGLDVKPVRDADDVPFVRIKGWKGGDNPPPGWRLSERAEALVMLQLAGRMRIGEGQRLEDVLTAEDIAFFVKKSRSFRRGGRPVTMKPAWSVNLDDV